MSVVVVLGVGLCLEMLVVVLPLLHLSATSGSAPTAVTLGLAALPFGALAACMARPGPWLTLAGFPLSHLPVLLVSPQLTGDHVYGGTGGLGALVLVVVFAALWCWIALRPASPPARAALSGLGMGLGWVTGLTALAIAVAFMEPVLRGPHGKGRLAQQVAVLSGWAIATLVSIRWVGVVAVDGMGEGRVRQRWKAQWAAGARVSPSVLWGNLVAAALLGTVVVVVYGL